MKHTKGKLIETPKAKGNIESKETGRYIASCMGYSSNVNSDKIIEENIANTKRIIKCWNTYDELLEALIEIERGKGVFDMDRLIHASNVIENMKTIAKKAIKKAKS